MRVRPRGFWRIHPLGALWKVEWLGIGVDLGPHGPVPRVILAPMLG